MADLAPRQPRLAAIRAEPQRVELDLEISPDLVWFHGHFTSFPILPGVVQLDWALAFAREHLGLALEAARQFQVKYKSGIFPNDHVTLVLTHVAAKNRLSFEYRRNGALCSSGQLTVPQLTVPQLTVPTP